MVRVQLSEQQWSKVHAFLQAERGAGWPAVDDRDFIEAVLWWRHGGAVARPRGAGMLTGHSLQGKRAQRIPHDSELYKARSEIECTFSLLKQARRFATRYEKTLPNYAAVVALGCALLWLRI